MGVPERSTCTQKYDAIAACFTPDATVVDEEKTYRGTAVMRAWLQETREQYQFRSVPTRVEALDGGALVTCHVTGDFPGSFRLEGEQIASLEIIG